MQKNRELMAFRRNGDYVVAGRCSICHRPFESSLEVPELASNQVVSEFDAHACDEDFALAAFRVVKEATDKV